MLKIIFIHGSARRLALTSCKKNVLRNNCFCLPRNKFHSLSQKQFLTFKNEIRSINYLLKASNYKFQIKSLFNREQVCLFRTSATNYGSDDPSKKNKDKKDDKNDEKISNAAKTVLALFIAYASMTLISLLFPNANQAENLRYVSWTEFFYNMLAKGEVKELIVKPELNLVIINLEEGAIIKGRRAEHLTYHMNITGVNQFEEKLRTAERSLGITPENEIPVIYERARDNMWILLVGLVGVALTILFMFRSGQFKPPSTKDLISSFTRAPFTIMDPHNPKSRIYFKDVAGLKEAKVEIMEFVDYLKKPEKYRILGAKIPKGVLLLGPPGCGKTMLAKAVATEAGVPFLAMAGSEFIEMIGGLGAARVRDLFAEARKRAPSIIYIDEIDTIGRHRETAHQASSGEEEQTLNQLLVEMDGMATTEGVIMLASTNRAEVLDKALLRRGRFDKHILIDLPNLIERNEIFQQHLKSITLEEEPQFYSYRLAQLTPGFSGADIANVCNEAALHAARDKKKKVTKEDLEYAVERVIGGTEKRSHVMTPAERRIVAFHECGHVLVSWLLKHPETLMKVSIVPRTTTALGFSQYLPSDQKLYSKEQLFERMCAGLGGRVAETIVFNQVTTSAADDLKKVTKMAYDQIQRFGMDDVVGLLSFPSKEEIGPFQPLPYSKHLANTIDFQARQLVARAFIHTENLLRKNLDKLNKLAEALLQKETLNYDEIEAIIGPSPHGKKLCVEIPDWGQPLTSSTEPPPPIEAPPEPAAP